MTYKGRCLAKEESRLLIRNLAGNHSVEISNSEIVALGDIIEVKDGAARVLTRHLSKTPGSKWIQRILDPRRLHAMAVRQKVYSAIRDFFNHQEFLETQTPLLVPSPGMETHIRPFSVQRPQHLGSGKTYLPTSPEFAMKRLLVGGLERIYQISQAFREEPRSITHHPEFTMLEWYRAYSGYEQIMVDTESLFESIAMKLFGKPSLLFQGHEISVKRPWPRLKVRDLFQQLDVDLVKCSSSDALAEQCLRLGLSANPQENWDDLYFKIWLNLIEPKLPPNQAVFVTRYPKSQAALSAIDHDADGSQWAKRFEVYAGGLELGNAFEELTDAAEQRKRFVHDMDLREQIYGADFERNAIDEEFLEALAEGMPPSGGIAIGVDRMVMLFANEADIDYTLWLRSGDYTTT
jgi:lysyl-tRNA synthetase class 2